MKNNTKERVLVFGDDMRIFLAVARSLGRAGKEVHAAPFNWQAPALKSKYIHTVHRLPRYSDGPAGWLAAVLRLLESEAFDLVLPCCDDRSIIPFHLHRDAFKPYRIAIPSGENMDLLFDKQLTRELAAELDVPVVPGARLRDDDSAADLVAQYGLPLVVKPRRSYWPDKLDGWGKVFIVESERELTDVLAAVQERARYLVESYFQGVGVGVSVLADNGTIVHAFQHRRLREGWGGSSSFRISEPLNPELYEACRKICGRTKLNGVCMFEFRFDAKSRKWVLLETNARFWGSISLPVSLGVDFPVYLYDFLVHQRHHAPVTYATGVRSRNIVLDGLNIVAGLRHLRRSGIVSLIADLGLFAFHPIGWLAGREYSDSFVLDDLQPGFAECALLAKTVRHKFARQGNTIPARRAAEKRA